jgi:transcriptional regulator with XRE-family HTH domain
MLRGWRQRRRLSQLALAVQADVSTRHLSFVESGRAQASRELLLHLAEKLHVPLRDRNSLLIAGGYAPVYSETPMDAESMRQVREAIDQLLSSHEPYPAIIVDRVWDVVAANQPALAIISEGLSPALLSPRVNALRVSLHPEGLAPRIVNFGEWRAHLLERLRRQMALTGSPELADLYEELVQLPDGSSDEAESPDHGVFVPLRIRSHGRELSFFSTIATFGAPADITLAELAIESFFPANLETAAALRE